MVKLTILKSLAIHHSQHKIFLVVSEAVVGNLNINLTMIVKVHLAKNSEKKNLCSSLVNFEILFQLRKSKMYKNQKDQDILLFN